MSTPSHFLRRDRAEAKKQKAEAKRLVRQAKALARKEQKTTEEMTK